MDSLTVAPCSHTAARYAVEHWHYSGSMPTPPIVKFGVWEHEQYRGCVLVSRGANKSLGAPYGLRADEVCELTRVALTTHTAPVSQIVSAALARLRADNPGIRLVISYADPYHGHRGGIYQAGNWLYAGQTAPSKAYIDRHGNRLHPRQVGVTGWKRQYGEYRRVPTPDECRAIDLPGKHRYLYPLDRAMRRKIAPLALPYPRPADEGSTVSCRVSDSEGQVQPLASAL